MLLKYIKYNWCLMIKQKTFRFAFIMMLSISVIVPIYNVIKYFGFYEYALPSADTLYIGNNGGELWDYFSLIFPFFIVLPYGLSFLNENNSGVVFYVQTRGDKKDYYYGQLITCFIGNAIIFLLPFLLNIVLNSLLFPINGNDYVSTYNAYENNWANTIMGKGFYKETIFEGYIFKRLAIFFPQLYNLIYTLWISFASGIMGMFTYAVSIILKKGSIFLLIANYLFFMIFNVLDRIIEQSSLPLYINTNLTDYLSNGHFNQGLVYSLYLVFLLCELIGCIFIIKHRLKEDEV